MLKNVETFYPLSPMQQGMYFHGQFAPDSGVYVELFSSTLTGRFNLNAFEQAWREIVARHAVLRSAFVGDGLKEPVQFVQRAVELPIIEQDWRALDSETQQMRLEAFLDLERRRGFDLAKAPLMRIYLIHLGSDRVQFVWLYHHILLDGWSMPLILQEFMALYETLAQGADHHLPPPNRQFRDYIVWLKQQDEGMAKAFWQETLNGMSAPTPLHFAPATSNQHQNALEIETTLSPEVSRQLAGIAKEHQLTMNAILSGVWGLLLSRTSGETEVIFGTTVSGRPTDLPGSEAMIGLFINSLPVRLSIQPEVPVIHWLQTVQNRLVEMRQFEYSPLVDIQAWSDFPRGTSLFDSLFIYENYPVDAADTEASEDGLNIKGVISVEETNYPLNIISGPGEEIVIKFLFDTGRFDEAGMRQALGHFKTLLEEIAHDHFRPLGQLPMLTAAESQLILQEWNQTAEPFPDNITAADMFEQFVARYPEHLALYFEGESLTYTELDQKANRLAHYLQKAGVGPETIVALYVDRSPFMLIGLLGIMKAGGAYVPLDPNYPAERLGHILADTQAPLLLTQQHLLSNLPDLEAFSGYRPELITLDQDWDKINAEPATRPESAATADSLAYVIFTSGSTGKPKGAMMPHRGLCSMATTYNGRLGIKSTSRVLQFFSFGFDGSLLEICMAIFSGGTLYIPRKETVLSMPDLQRYIQTHEISDTIMTPTMLAALPADDLPHLKTVIAGGEACTAEVVARWAPGRRMFNAYGPTEATICTTLTEIKPGEEITIGRPLGNVTAYVLDPHMQPVPVGTAGELHLGGVQVGRGYLKRPELTAEKFIKDRFSDHPNARLYKTGDLVRFTPDGKIAFAGRIDHQVKLRGYRIELGEIEEGLIAHPAIRDAVVMLRSGSVGNKFLAAYLVMQPEQQQQEYIPTADELRSFLEKELPHYMLPARFVLLDSFPLNHSGKVDRKALPDPDVENSLAQADFEPPQDEIEIALAKIWEEILETAPIGLSDNFFELGGHSILSIRLIGQIKKEMGYQLSLTTLFQNPTVRALAEIMRRFQERGILSASSLVEIEPTGTKDPIFFIHPSGGSLHWYTELSQLLNEDRPIIGLQARGMYGEEPLHTTVAAMASHYVQEIRAYRPEGPYHICGWSFGVIVAYEVARQLNELGQTIGMLAILDAGPVHPSKRPEDQAAYLYDVFSKPIPTLALETLRSMPDELQIAHLYNEGKRANWILPEVTADQFEIYVTMLKTQAEAWHDYQHLHTYPHDIHLFRAEIQEDEDSNGILSQVAQTLRKRAKHMLKRKEIKETGPNRDDMGWSDITTGTVHVAEVPGDHLSMLEKPNVGRLAHAFQTALERIEHG